MTVILISSVRFSSITAPFKEGIRQKLSRDRLIRLSILSAFIVAGLILTSITVAVAQHDMHKMPGMSKSEPKAKKKRSTRKKRPAKKHRRFFSGPSH